MGFTEHTRWKGGRGPKRWSFTARDIAAATGLTPAQVRRLANADVFDPSDLASLSRFVAERSGEAAARAARAVLVAAGGDVRAAAAVLGVSRATLYRRARAAAPNS